MMRATYRFAAAVLGLLVAGCASNPPILVALPGPPAGVARPPDQSSGATLLLRQVTLPGYLDSFTVVVDRKANTLVVSDDAEWAERLRDAVTRNLRDALSQRLGASRVLPRGRASHRRYGACDRILIANAIICVNARHPVPRKIRAEFGQQETREAADDE